MYPINVIENPGVIIKPSPMPVVDTLSKTIRISETTSAQRENGFDIYHNKYETGYPQNTSYDICRQVSSSVFMSPNRFYRYRDPNNTTTVYGNLTCE